MPYKINPFNDFKLDYYDNAVTTLDWQESVIDQINFTTSESASPSSSDRYINTTTGTSNVTSQTVTANYIYQWNGAGWTEIVPDNGTVVNIENLSVIKVYDGSSWVLFGSYINFTDLGQTPSGFTKSGALYRVNAAGTAIEEAISASFSGEDLYLGANKFGRSTESFFDFGISTESIAIQNDFWLSAYASGSTSSVVNMFKLNVDNDIEIGASLLIDSIDLPEDGGALTFIDMPVSSASATGSEMSYYFNIDSENILAIYAESDGVGGIQSQSVKLDTILELTSGSGVTIENVWLDSYKVGRDADNLIDFSTDDQITFRINGADIAYSDSAGNWNFKNNEMVGLLRVTSTEVRTSNFRPNQTGTNKKFATVYNSTSDGCQLNITNLTTGATEASGLGILIDQDEKALLWNYHNSDLKIGTNDTEFILCDAAGSEVYLKTSVVRLTTLLRFNASVNNIDFGNGTSNRITYATNKTILRNSGNDILEIDGPNNRINIDTISEKTADSGNTFISDIHQEASNGAEYNYKTISEEVTIAVGSGLTGVVTTGNLAPANCLIKGIAFRVTQAPGGGATTVDIGITGGDLDAYIDGASCDVLDEIGDFYTNGSVGAPIINRGAATTLTLTTDANVTVTDMKIRVQVFYETISAPTS